MIIFALMSVSSVARHASIYFRIGSKLRCMRSTPIEMESTRANDFECLAKTGVKSPLNVMLEQTKTRYPQVPNAWSCQANCEALSRTVLHGNCSDPYDC